MSENAKQLLHTLLADQVREPPLFDWREQLTCADEIIKRVGAPVRNSSSKLRPSRPTDLRPHREDIAKLLAELHEMYLVALDDFEMRSNPHRPERKLRKQDIRRYSAADEVSAGFDYSEFEVEPDQTWEKFWDETYGRRRGNPGSSRKGGPPLQPLHGVYRRVQLWWRGHDLGKFHPGFGDAETGYDEASFNAPARFLLSLMQALDQTYTAENARGLYETIRKSE